MRERLSQSNIRAWLAGRPATAILAGLTLLVLALSLPGSLRDALDRGEIYLFSHVFLEDIPKRLAGPGRFRFILQPAIATLLGIRSGLADARAGRPPYLYGVLFHRRLRRERGESRRKTSPKPCEGETRTSRSLSSSARRELVRPGRSAPHGRRAVPQRHAGLRRHYPSARLTATEEKAHGMALRPLRSDS
jgi:hypothetical protein